MQNEDNNYTTTNQTYKIWKKHSPFLYNLLQVYQLSSCSQSIDWFNDYYIDNDWKIYSLLIGSNSISQNSLQVISVALPTDDSITDYSIYRQEKPDIHVGSNGFVGTMGLQQLNTRTIIPQASQIMKTRINHHDQHLIAVKTGGADAELILYDLRNKQDQLQTNSIKLSGHTDEGFALSWSPHSSHKLLSGSYDKIINLYDINNSQESQLSLKCSDGVQDVKWSNFESNIFCSANQDQKINLWDIRQGEGRPFLSRKAHTGEVYTIDFSNKSQYLLLSGGQDGDVCLWDIRNISKKLHSFVGHNNQVNVVSWSPYNSLQFASGSSDNRIVIWDIEKLNDNTQDKSGNEIIFIHGGHRSKVTDLNWGRQKDTIGSCEQNNILQIWKMNERIQSDL